MIKKILLTVFLIINLFLASTAFAQSTGDYRSNVNTTGNWTSASSWQYYNGTAWVAATNYPGQIAGNYAVLIQAGDVITIGISGIITEEMGTLTINGSLVLTGTNSGGVGTNFIFNTPTVIVTPLLGTIKFIDKVNLKLPTNATLQVEFDLTPNPDYYGLIGDCNHNQDIVIGTSTYAYCNGGGSTGLTFYEVMSGGGTLNSVPSSNSPICYGNTIMLNGSYIGPIGSGITYTWTITDPFGVTTTVNTKDTSIVNAITGSYSAKLTCSTVYDKVAYSNSETITVVVNSLPSAPTITTTQPTCTVSTGSVVLSGLPATGTLNQTRGTVVTSSPITGTTTTISGLASGTYTYTVSNGNCTSGTSTSVTIKSSTNTWNGTAWSNGSDPVITENIVFNGNYASPTNLQGCSCTVNADVIINSGHTLTLTNKLTVTNFGSMAFLDKASLVQINNVENEGFIDYQRITAARKTDYTYWSSPVSPMTLGELYTDGGTFYSYEVTTAGEDWSFFGADTDMVAGKGYIANQGAEIPSAGSPPSNELDVTFTGVPNNGHYEIDNVIADRSYLLGNPYPSALDADEFLTDNAAVLSGTLYFWTHNTAIQDATNITNGSAGSGAFAYTSDDYATYNITGGVGIDSGTKTSPATNPGNNMSTPSGKIASGQGFFASTKAGIPATSKIVYDNTMRVGVNGITGNNSQFFKTKNPNGKTANTKVIEKNRVWLNLTNTQGAFKQTLVGYITGATNEYDDRFDGESFDGNEFVDFYSVNQDKNLTIQGRALPFDENDEVPLGFRTTINGDFTINIDQVDGSLVNQAVFIEDKLTNTITDLKSGNYTFNTVAGTFDDRFVLKYTNKTLSLDTIDKEDGILAFYSNNYKTLIIKNNLAEATVNSVALFNMLGQKIENWDVRESEQTDVQIPIKNMSSGIYVVKIKTTKGESSKKIIVN